MDFIDVHFTSYADSIKKALTGIKAEENFSQATTILLKPNLINKSPHPITTPPACCEAIIESIRSCSQAEIIIGEGCGDLHSETDEVFESLGYTELAKKYNIQLVDLNRAELQELENPSCKIFPQMYLPKIVLEAYTISVPVLKAHSLAKITGSLKNMIGAAPPSHYSGNYGSWKKALFHRDMQQSIIELNRYLLPDLSIMDCTVGMAEFHLGGPHCDPPVNKIIAGYNAFEVDRYACGLLGLDWQAVKHVAVGFVASPQP